MNRLKELRKEKRLTQSDMGKILNISQNTYSYWEQGKTKIDNHSLELLSRFFNATIDYILAIESKKEPHIDVELSSEETELIKQFRALSPQGQSHVLATAQLLGTTGKEQILP